MRRGVRRGLLLLVTATIMAGGAAAQDPIQPTRPAQVPPGAIVQPLGPDAGAALRSYLTTLADNPRSLDALLGAGREALRMGDAEASLGFYARADEVSPRNARVKAGMASAFVQLGQPQAALRLFEEAASLGAPAAEFAADRGLAFDMAGDPARAQQEYVLAMRLRDEPELRRRMALSLAITGQRDAALRLIDAQLRRHDRAAWRTQAFVLALTGDAAGASRTAQNVLPAGTAQAMAPFLSQLATLSPSQKAMAVHFGQFPSHGARAAAAPVAADPAALALAMGGAPAATPPSTRPAAVSSRNSRRRTAQAQDSSDPHRLRETGRTSRRPTQTASRPAQSASPPLASQPVPATSQPAATGQRPVEVAEVNTRWAGAPYPPAQSAPVIPPPSPSIVPPPSPPPAPIVQSQPRQPPVMTQPPPSTLATQSRQAPVTAQPPPSPATTQTFGIASEPSQQSASPPSASTRIASSATTLPAVIPSAPGPVQPPAVLPSATSSAPDPVQSSPVTVSVNLSAEPSVQPPSSPAAGPAVGPTAVPGFSLEPPAPAAAPAAQGLGTAFADIAALVNSLPPEERSAPAAPPTPTPAAPPPRRTEPLRTAQNRPAESRATTRQRPAQPAHPSRHWVQIAGGANRAALPREFTRLRTLAPQQLGRRDAYTTTARATNRLLVGPFASNRAAQEFVNQLAGRNVTAFAWTSAAGQEIERLQTR